MKPTSRTLPILFIAVFGVFALSCEKRETDGLSSNWRKSTVSAEELEAMLTVAGQEYVTTVGTQQAVSPYENHGSSGGVFGSSFRFENLSYTVPKDGREYIVRRFLNPDGSAFMKVSKYPEGVGKSKPQ